MKKYYILVVLIIVVAIFSSSLGAKIDSLSPIIQGFSMLAFVVPTCLLLYLIGKDKKIRKGFRLAAKIGIAFVILCYLCGFWAEFL